MSTLFSRARAAACLALIAAASFSAPAWADNKTPPAFDAFAKTFADVKDYQEHIVVHETTDDGKQTQDRTYDYRWMRPTYAQIEIIDGPGKGSGAAWRGGDQIRGHQGGLLSGMHMMISIHDPRAASLRGDNLEVASFEWQMKHFETTPGTLSEAPGPTIDGQATTAVTLLVTSPKDNGNVSKDVLYIGKDKHLPVRREQYVGSTLVKTETFKDLKLNNGFKPDDFS
jgi:outer membrane lipoprotein-sorting protein